jgi:molybdopterin biosynthesis enzyme
MIRTMLGATNVFRNVLSLTLENDLKSPKGLTSFVRASIEAGEKVQALPRQNQLISVSDATGLIVVPEKVTEYRAGDVVNVMILERSNN